MKARKYDYLKILQGYYPETGWEDIEAADESKPEEVKELRADLKSYRKEDPRPYRIVRRRVKAGTNWSAS